MGLLHNRFIQTTSIRLAIYVDTYTHHILSFLSPRLFSLFLSVSWFACGSRTSVMFVFSSSRNPKLFCFVLFIVYSVFCFTFFFFFLVFSIVSLFVLVLFCLFFSCCLPHCLPSDFRTLLSVFLFCSVRSREKKDLKKNEKNVPYWSSVENRLRVPHLSYNPSSWKNFDICMSVYNTAVYPSRSSLAALRIFAFVCPPLWQSLCT